MRVVRCLTPRFASGSCVTEVRWTRRARGDLEAIHAFISRDSEHFADTVVRAIIKAVDRLEDYPESGRIVPEIEDRGLRELTLVHHGSRSFPSL